MTHIYKYFLRWQTDKLKRRKNPVLSKNSKIMTKPTIMGFVKEKYKVLAKKIKTILKDG